MTAAYLYCIVKAARKPSLVRAPAGLPNSAELTVVGATPTLWIVTSQVPTNAYAGPTLERSLKDLEWVGRIALSHEAVVEHFARQASSTVVPMKLFTMFSSVERAVADIRGRQKMILAAMRKIGGADEWGVRVLRRTMSDPPRASRGGTTSGTAFLAAKKQARDAARDARAAGAEAAMETFTVLSTVARDAQRRDVVPEGGTPPLLDAVFLVPRRRRVTFERSAAAAATRCAEAGAELTLSGPWPAYNFVAVGAQR